MLKRLHDDILATAPLAHLALRANAGHEAALQCLNSSVAHAREAGKALLQAKDLVPYGQWLKWQKANLKFAVRTAELYMRLANLPEKESQRKQLCRVAGLPLNGASVGKVERAVKRLRRPVASLTPLIEHYDELPCACWCRARGCASRSPGYRCHC